MHCGSFWGVAKLVKAPDFDSGIRRFESFLLSHIASGRSAASADLPDLLSGQPVARAVFRVSL
jgi:hypothetical protein